MPMGYHDRMPALPERTTAILEVPRGSRVKRHPDGRLQYVSPLASPFDYGFAPDVPHAPDGDPQDVLLVGRPHPLGVRVPVRIVGVVELLDAGLRDDKWIAVPADEERPRDLEARVRSFFVRYRRMKNLLASARRRRGVLVLDHWFRPT
jgi:inorganic pyrophosphatase